MVKTVVQEEAAPLALLEVVFSDLAEGEEGQRALANQSINACHRNIHSMV